jgi:hypothetical protein
MPAIDKQKTIKATNLTRNSEVTKTQILDAAEAEFAVTGLCSSHGSNRCPDRRYQGDDLLLLPK